MTLTPPRRLTFSERMKLTFMLWRLRLPAPAAWLRAVWSSGATVSLSPIDRLPVKAIIESGNGNVTVEVNIKKKRLASRPNRVTAK